MVSYSRFFHLGLSSAATCLLICLTVAGQTVDKGTSTHGNIREDSAADGLNRGRKTGLTGPLLGLAFDKRSGFHAIHGIPGTAVLGPAIEGVAGVQDAAVSSAGAYALAITGEERRLQLVRGLSDGPAAVSMLSVPAGVAAIATSPVGSAAALHYRERNTVLVLTGLPNAPRTAWIIELHGLTEKLDSIAVSDDGEVVLATTLGSGHPSLLCLTQPEGWRYLTSLQGSASIAFFVRAAEAVVAERQAHRVFLIRAADGEAAMAPLADRDDGIGQPVAVAVSGDNSSILVANSEPQGVVEFSVETGLASLLESRWNPGRLQRLRGNSVFLLSDPSDRPLLLYDGDSRQPRIATVSSQRLSRIPVETEGGER